jgi:hypothetical protein
MSAADKPKVYQLKTMQYSTSGHQIFHESFSSRHPETTHVVSVRDYTPSGITVHSQSPLKLERPARRMKTLREVWGAMKPCALLRGIRLTGDGEWLVNAFRRGTLVTCHDGSFMPAMSVINSSAAVVLCCTGMGNIASASYCEATAHEVASNYRGELIGGVISTFILRTLSLIVQPQVPPPVCIYCDNMGVVTHGNKVHNAHPESQPHLDLILLIQRNIIQSRLQVRYVHVYGHLDNNQEFSQLSLPQQLNIMADDMAKQCLLHHINNKISWGSTYPHEPACIWVEGVKVTSSIKNTLYRSWGSRVAKKLFQRRCIVDIHSFDRIAWDHVDRAMSRYPQMFAVWVTKHVSGFNGTNRQLSKFQAEILNK